MLFGLIGKPISHSKSAKLFEAKFKKIHQYRLFELEQLNEIHKLIKNHPDLSGLNVTIPYKKEIFDYLNEVEAAAAEIGAVNTIIIERRVNDFYLKGYNTDFIGFERAYASVLSQNHSHALILGTGGASLAVAYVLRKFTIPFYFVSRKKHFPSCLHYDDLVNFEKKVSLIINTTPVGMFPNINDSINIPEVILKNRPYVIDLIYNPLETLIMKNAQRYGCFAVNGMDMLKYQAEESWRLWKLC
ncbi:MAG TPA: shikimate dehydrogenase [Bacteroidales bacterium]|nr:shikimate dehydrogenase [Bacteroidales bacterium]